MEENKKTKERIEINIDNTDSAIGWLERLLVLLKEYGVWRILGATLIVVVSVFLYFMLNLKCLKSMMLGKLDNMMKEWNLECKWVQNTIFN